MEQFLEWWNSNQALIIGTGMAIGGATCITIVKNYLAGVIAKQTSKINVSVDKIFTQAQDAMNHGIMLIDFMAEEVDEKIANQDYISIRPALLEKRAKLESLKLASQNKIMELVTEKKELLNDKVKKVNEKVDVWKNMIDEK